MNLKNLPEASIEGGARHRALGQVIKTTGALLPKFVLCGVLALLVGCESSSKPTKPSSATAQPASPLAVTEQPLAAHAPTISSANQPLLQVVRVRILRGNGSEPVEGTVEWTDGMTVFDALSSVSPPIAVESTGQGESLFVKSIAGQANLGSAGDNWIYRVNGQLGDRSSGAYELEAGDEVLWSFGKYE